MSPHLRNDLPHIFEPSSAQTGQTMGADQKPLPSERIAESQFITLDVGNKQNNDVEVVENK